MHPRRLSQLTSLACLLLGALFAAPLNVRAEPYEAVKRSDRIQLQRLTPSGWISMLVPADCSPPVSKADIDGRFIDCALIRIDYSYYAYVNTPHFLIDSATGRPDPKSRRPYAGSKATWVGGRRAWITALGERNRSRHSLRHGYNVELFDLPVHVGDGTMLRGTIRFEISTSDPRYLSDLWRIIRSIQFHSRPQPN